MSVSFDVWYLRCRMEENIQSERRHMKYIFALLVLSFAISIAWVVICEWTSQSRLEG